MSSRYYFNVPSRKSSSIGSAPHAAATAKGSNPKSDPGHVKQITFVDEVSRNVRVGFYVPQSLHPILFLWIHN
jgi:hypothetical protein